MSTHKKKKPFRLVDDDFRDISVVKKNIGNKIKFLGLL